MFSRVYILITCGFGANAFWSQSFNSPPQKIDGKIQVTLIQNWPAHRIAIFESYMIYENDMIYDKSHYLIDI